MKKKHEITRKIQHKTELTCGAEGGDGRRGFIVATAPFLELIIPIQLANHLFGQARERTVCRADKGDKNASKKG